MAAPRQQAPDPFAHGGPWTEQELLDLPTDERVELIDGSLVVSPFSANPHQWLAFGLCVLLMGAAPRGVRAFGPAKVRLATDRILIPDVAVVRRLTRSTQMSAAADVLLAIEIVSPGNTFMDRVVKPALYAEAGIPTYLRIEPEPSPVGYLHELVEGAYREVACGPVLTLTRPFPVTLDLPALDDLEDT